MRTHSKIALKLFLINTIVILVFGGSTYYFFNQYSYVDFYKRLETRANILAQYNFESDRLNAQAVIDLRNRHLERLDNETEYIIPITKGGGISSLSHRTKLSESLLKEIYTEKIGKYKSGNTLYAGIRYNHEGLNYLVVVSASNSTVNNQLNFLRNILIIGGIFIALLSIYFSVFISRTIFGPISNITKKVKKISTDSMHLRLEESENNHEITELIATFNDLLNRIETAFETQKNFISNASHELSTPLTAIIGEAEVTLIKDRENAEYKEVLEKVLVQAERLDNITKSLLFLAQTGYASKKPVLEPIRMDELVWEVKQTIDKINPKNDILIDAGLFPDDSAKLTVSGNRQLLHLAIANVLSNACKYSSNKQVYLAIATTDRELIILIKDQGVGIPEGELPFIYDPFFRASNTGMYEGYGIGLPLTRNIIRLHQGKLSVDSKNGEGTNVEIRLPLTTV